MITRETSEPEYCTVAEAAQLLRVSVPTVRRWIASGRLPATKVGERSVRVERSKLRRLGRPAHARRTLSRDELDRYTLPSPPRTMTEAELREELAAINARIRARNGGKPLESSIPLIHEQRR